MKGINGWKEWMYESKDESMEGRMEVRIIERKI